MVCSLHFVVIVDFRDLSHNLLKNLSSEVFSGIDLFSFSSMTL